MEKRIETGAKTQQKFGAAICLLTLLNLKTPDFKLQSLKMKWIDYYYTLLLR